MQDKLVGARAEVKDEKGAIVFAAKPGRLFRFDTFPVEEGFDLLGSAMKSFGAVVAAVMGGDIGSAMVSAMTSGFNVPEVKAMVLKLLSVVSCLDPTNVDSKGLPTGFVTMNGTFKGRYAEMFEVASESFQYNYADFLEEIRRRTHKGSAQPASQTIQSPPT